MAVVCKLCTCGNRNKIESELLQKRISLKTASEMVGCSKSSIMRHMENHVKPIVAEAMKTEPAMRSFVNAANTLLNYLQKAETALAIAEENRDIPTMLKAINEARKIIETAANLAFLDKEDKKDQIIEVRFI